MTYDFHGSWDSYTGHNAPLYKNGDPGPEGFYIDAAVQAYLDAGAPADQLVLGLAMYGRSWTGVAGAEDGLFQDATRAGPGTWEAGSLEYDDIAANYLPRLDRHWDSQSKTPYLYDPAMGVFITYDDVQSIGIKADYIDSKGLAGGMFWELSSDRNSELLTELNRVIR